MNCPFLILDKYYPILQFVSTFSFLEMEFEIQTNSTLNKFSNELSITFPCYAKQQGVGTLFIKHGI